MTVYTVTSLDDLARCAMDRCTVGSYTTRGKALDEAVDYLVGRLALRDDLAYSMAHDENHLETAELFCEGRDGVWKLRRGSKRKLKDYVRDELGGQGCYYIYDGNNVWHLDIDENDVEGELWTTVTWGDSDCEDPEFTTPWPETFTSVDTAIKTFVNYAKDLMASRDMKIPDDFYAVVETRLSEDGKCQVDLDDGCSVSCVLYHTDAKNVKE